MKNILCFGDSNTYGYNVADGGRLERHLRWTGILQSLLKEDYYVIEEGLNGRTTVFEDPLDAGRRGISAINSVLQTHIPLDLVIVMLGTNDTKPYFAAPAEIIAKGAAKLCLAVKNFDYGGMPIPEVLLVSPIIVGHGVNKGPMVYFDETSCEKSWNFAELYKKSAAETGSHFFDAASVTAPSNADLVHLDQSGHMELAKALCSKIKELGI